MDWLLPRQAHIEQALAKGHLSEATLRCMMSARPTSKAVAARWRAAATAATAHRM